MECAQVILIGVYVFNRMSISGHKVYGPKGVGALFVRRRPRVRLEALINGGGQERGMRSGTLATPLTVGLGAACEVARTEMPFDTAHIKRLSERLVKGITSQLDQVRKKILHNLDDSNYDSGCSSMSYRTRS